MKRTAICWNCGYKFIYKIEDTIVYCPKCSAECVITH